MQSIGDAIPYILGANGCYNLPSGSMTVSHKFVVGARVRVGRHDAVIEEHTGVNAFGIPEYRILYSDPDKGEDYVMETQIDRHHVPTTEKKCECGVDSIGYGVHSSWCAKAEKV